jgi:hypothetical protein
MVSEEIAAKKKILDSLEQCTKQAIKLSKELGVRYVPVPHTGIFISFISNQRGFFCMRNKAKVSVYQCLYFTLQGPRFQ